MRETWPRVEFALVATALAIGIHIWVVRKRGALRRHQQRAVEMEVGWSSSQKVPVDGYLAWLRSPRPVFDVILRTAGQEQRIVDEIRDLDARIITSCEPRRVRVEIPKLPYARGIEGNENTTIPDVRTMKVIVARVVTPLVDELGIERIEMGTPQSLML
ncbi:MAG: hypothetical protein M3619_07130 [Myxococcota bacterium]|nr:hypothetical protein [Myxococcota bacterium]